MHIPDDDERFLSRYDGRQWAELVARSGAASAVVYAMGHVGLALYPSKVIPQHKGLNGRDLFAEGVDGCHERGIAVSAYLSVIFDTWAYRHNPGWKMIGVDGLPIADQSRYGTCCPNSPYRDYIAAFTRELCERYTFEGIRFDMTFWPHVCYCPHCRARFQTRGGRRSPYPRELGGSDLGRVPEEARAVAGGAGGAPDPDRAPGKAGRERGAPGIHLPPQLEVWCERAVGSRERLPAGRLLRRCSLRDPSPASSFEHEPHAARRLRDVHRGQPCQLHGAEAAGAAPDQGPRRSGGRHRLRLHRQRGPAGHDEPRGLRAHGERLPGDPRIRALPGRPARGGRGRSTWA